MCVCVCVAPCHQPSPGKRGVGRSVFLAVSCLHASVKTGLFPARPRQLLGSFSLGKAKEGNPDRALTERTLTSAVTAACYRLFGSVRRRWGGGKKG